MIRWSIACSALLAIAACSDVPSVTGVADPNTVRISSLDPANGNAADFVRCLVREDDALVSAHRGRSSLSVPANLTASMDAVFASVPAIMEVDVRTSSDGGLVLLHDQTLDRETNCIGPVSDYTLDELRDCRVEGADTGIQTLGEVLDWARGRTILQLDVKRDTRFEDVLAEVTAADAADRVIIITYSVDAAVRVARLHPTVAISVTIRTLDDLESLLRRGVAQDRIFAWLGTERVNSRLVASLDQRGIPSIFGTLGPPDRSIDSEIANRGDEARYAEFIEAGVDVVATDRPIQAARAIGLADTTRCATELR